MKLLMNSLCHFVQYIFSDIVFDSVQLMYYKYHQVNFTHGDLYIDSPDWIKKEKATTNTKNKDDKCF